MPGTSSITRRASLSTWLKVLPESQWGRKCRYWLGMYCIFAPDVPATASAPKARHSSTTLPERQLI